VEEAEQGFGAIRAAPRRIAEVRTRFRVAAKHPFTTHTRSRTLAAPTAEDRVVFDTAWDLYWADTHAGRAVRLIGPGLSARAQSTVQPGPFADMDAREPDHADDRIDATLDAIRRSPGTAFSTDSCGGRSDASTPSLTRCFGRTIRRGWRPLVMALLANILATVTQGTEDQTA
jgi:hypothetical protein